MPYLHGAKENPMRKELEQKMRERWPGWFNPEADVRQTLMSWGFCHDDGWFSILWRHFENLEPLVAAFEQESGFQFEVLQVKEKFGSLRIHVNHANDAIRQRLGAAQLESLHTCEICGQPGKQHSGDWSKTLCDEHKAQLNKCAPII
jgi:hypothetical protein